VQAGDEEGTVRAHRGPGEGRPVEVRGEDEEVAVGVLGDEPVERLAVDVVADVVLLLGGGDGLAGGHRLDRGPEGGLVAAVDGEAAHPDPFALLFVRRVVVLVPAVEEGARARGEDFDGAAAPGQLARRLPALELGAAADLVPEPGDDEREGDSLPGLHQRVASTA
jgi:hypothetical protein